MKFLPKTPTSPKKQILAWCFFFALVLTAYLQYQHGSLQYESLLAQTKHSILAPSDWDKLEVSGTGFLSESGSGSFYFQDIPQTGTGILLVFQEETPFPLEIRLTASTSQGEQVSQRLALQATSNFLYLPLESDISGTVTLTLTNKTTSRMLGYRPASLRLGAEEARQFQVAEIFLLESDISPSQLKQWQFSLPASLGLFLLFFSLCYFGTRFPNYGQVLLPYAILFLYFYLKLHQIDRTGDDAVLFFHMKDSYNLLEYSIMRYQDWNGRFLIEIFPYYLVHHLKLWAALNSAMVLLLAYSFSAMFPKLSEKSPWIFPLVCLFFPMDTVSDVGWVATSTNYLWVMVAVVYSLLPVAKFFRGKTCSGWLFGTSLFATLYGANHEQSAAVLLGFYLVFFAYALWKKTCCHQFLPHFFLVVASLLSHLLCPGNLVRSETDLTYQFPEMIHYSFWDKLALGFTSTMSNFFTLAPSYWLMFLCLLCGTALWNLAKSRKSSPQKPETYELALIFGLVPLVYSLWQNFFSTSLKIGTNLQLALYLILVFSLISAIFYIFQDKSLGFLAVIVFLAGFASRIIIGFSPGVKYGGGRTYIFCFGAVMFLIFLLLEVILAQRSEKTFPQNKS